MKGVWIVNSKSNRATCEVCLKNIKDPVRIQSGYSLRYLHIYCAGFLVRKLKTLKGWDTLDPMFQDEEFLQELLDTEPR